MSIIQQLQCLSEDNLRQKIIIPLLYFLGCREVRDNDGNRENGKDIVYVNYNHFLRKEIVGAVILKITDIGKGVRLRNIEDQVRAAIAKFISHGDPRNKIRIHEIVVITSKKITQDAMEEVYNFSGANFQNIHFVDGIRLEFLINQVIIEHNKDKKLNYVFSVETFGTALGYQAPITTPSIVMFNDPGDQVFQG